MTKSCIICKKRFRTGYASKKTCSEACRLKHKQAVNAAYKKAHPQIRQYTPKPAAAVRTCEHCGIEFIPKSKNHPNQRYCTPKCNFASYYGSEDHTRNKKQYKRREAATVTAIRGCLCCGRMFESRWIGNRVCDTCAGAEEYRCYAFN